MARNPTGRNGAPEYTPEPEEIRESCRNLQRGWTAEQERRRRTGQYAAHPYTIPVGVVLPVSPEHDTRVI